VTQLSWSARLTADQTAAVLALLQAATESDGLPPVSESVLMAVRHGAAAGRGPAHLLASDGAQLVGYAHLDFTDRVTGATGELAVHPAHRRRGVAGEMVRELMAQAQRLTPGGTLRLWAHGEHPAAERMAGHYGFSRARVLWQLRRSLLTPLDEPLLPEGVTLRPFRPGEDEQAFLEVNNRAFAWHPEQGGWDVGHVLVREAEPWFDPQGFLLAVDADGRLLGFHWTKIHPHDLGEVYVLGVDPDEHGRGLGSALTLAGLRYLRGRGMREVMLYVEADNTAAIKTYERLGFQHWDTDVAYSAPSTG
jgi:mycothiol synthase